MWNRYPASFGWMLELMVTALHCYLKPSIRDQQFNKLTTTHATTPALLCTLHTIER